MTFSQVFSESRNRARKEQNRTFYETVNYEPDNLSFMGNPIMYFKLVWRNIWRAPRRTAVILIAVVVGVWSMVFLGALMRGISDQMVRNGIATLTGHIQIHHKGYRSDPVIENSIAKPSVVEKTLGNVLPADALWTSRVRVNAVAGNARHSSGLTLVGIHPLSEAKISFIGKAISQGRYLKINDVLGIVIGKALAEDFGTGLGKKLVLMSQDKNQELASRAFRIVGIFRAEMEATEKQFAFVSISAAQEMLGLNNEISEVSIRLSSRKEATTVASALRNQLRAGDYEIYTWQELLPLVTAVLGMYDVFIFLWFLVVFIAMGFGIVNTMLMAVFERMREFGLLKALGMKPWWIVRQVLTESFFLLVIGIFIGNGMGLWTVSALSSNGIDLSSLAKGMEFVGMSHIIYPAFYAKDMITANLVVFVLGLLVSLYPAIKAARFTPLQAMAHT